MCMRVYVCSECCISERAALRWRAVRALHGGKDERERAREAKQETHAASYVWKAKGDAMRGLKKKRMRDEGWKKKWYWLRITHTLQPRADRRGACHTQCSDFCVYIWTEKSLDGEVRKEKKKHRFCNKFCNNHSFTKGTAGACAIKRGWNYKFCSFYSEIMKCLQNI